KEVKTVIEDAGLNYEIENVAEAEKRANAFVKSVGITKARKAADNNQIKGAERAFVYAAIINRLIEISDGVNPDELQRISDDYHSAYDALLALDAESRSAGRFINALKTIYQNSAIEYNIDIQVGKYKAVNNGEIDPETLAKFKEAANKIKELETKLKDAEEAFEKAKAQQAIDDIGQSISRKKPDNNKIKAKAIANKLRKAKILKPDVFSSAAPAAIVWDGAIETIAKAIEAGGSISDSINKGINYIKKTDWYKNLTQVKKGQAVQSLREFANSNLSNQNVFISDDGKIKIPEQAIRNYVEEGLTDVDEIAQRIIDDFFPDSGLTLREVRDAITKYGRTVNMSKDEISIEIRKLKRIGKLISSMEDVMTGKRPLKSGLQRDKITQKEREMIRQINDGIRELPADESELETS